MCLKRVEKKKLLGLNNKVAETATRGVLEKSCSFKSFTIFTGRTGKNTCDEVSF